MSTIVRAAASWRQIRTLKRQSVDTVGALPGEIAGNSRNHFLKNGPLGMSSQTGERSRNNMLHSARALVLVLTMFSGTQSLSGQSGPAVTPPELPDSPGFQTTSSQSETQARGSASLSGTVEDQNGGVIQGAQVELNRLDASGEHRSQTLVSGANGEFTFRGLPAGEYKLIATGQGWGRFESPRVILSEAESKIVPGVVLPIATAVTEVRVGGSREEMATEQIHIAEQQRVLGVLPNFYTAFDWNAPPLDTKRKYQLAFRSITDPATFAGVAFISGIEQANDTYHGYGQGVQGYAKRYGAAYATDFTSRMLNSAVFPSLFHQDPRYFYRGTGTKKSRVAYAISSAILVRNDDGRRVPNYSRILGSFSAGAISNLYYPSGSRGVGLTISNGFVEIAGNAANNLVREFLLKRFTTHVSKGVNGQPD